MTPRDLTDKVTRYVQALQAGKTGAALDEFYHPDAVQIEYPNRLNPSGVTRDRALLTAASEAGQTSVAEQKYEIRKLLVHGQSVALELSWSARMQRSFGQSDPGTTMRAEFAVFLEFKDGRIVSQHNYDCFHPF